MSWTEERIERLKKMWHDGATASQIADELGGVSRNAVIGKAHRLGLEQRPSPVKPGEEKEAKKPAPAAAAAAAAAPKAERRSRAPTPDAPAAARRSGRCRTARGATPHRSAPEMQYRSIGPGGFIRQGPGDQQPPIPPAPPRRLVPAKPSPEVADKTSLLDLNDRICKWPMGHPGEPDFHFCGEPANPGFPYCVAALRGRLPGAAPAPRPPSAAAAAVRRPQGSLSRRLSSWAAARSSDWWRAPLWLLALATGAKSFVDNPILGSSALNRRGLHVARLKLAHRLAWARRRRLAAACRRNGASSSTATASSKSRDFLPADRSRGCSAALLTGIRGPRAAAGRHHHPPRADRARAAPRRARASRAAREPALAVAARLRRAAPGASRSITSRRSPPVAPTAPPIPSSSFTPTPFTRRSRRGCS